MVMDFENITFENFLEKAIAAVAILEKKVIALTELPNMLKLPALQPSDYTELSLTPPGKPGKIVDPTIPSAPHLT